MNLPNKLTIARIILVPFFLLFIIPLPKSWESLTIIENFNSFVNDAGRYVAGGIFAVAAFTDFLDGHIARSRKIVTNFGKFLDPIADKLLVSTALIALIKVDDLSIWFVYIILTREFIVSGMRLVAAKEGEVIAASVFGKIKMVTQTIAILLILFDNFPFNLITDIDIGQNMMIIAVIATILSGYDFLKKNFQIIKNGNQK